MRPSTLLTLYLGLSTILDLARIRTLFYLESADKLAAIFLAGFCVKVVLFALELYEKRRLLRPQWKNASPEATSSTYSRALFIWLNDLLIKGFRSSLNVDTLTPLDSDLLNASEPEPLLARWNKGQHCRAHLQACTNRLNSGSNKEEHIALDLYFTL